MTTVISQAVADHVLALARQAAAAADRAREAATQAAATREVDWCSAAADGFRARLAEESRRVERAARCLDDAAVAVADHARALQALEGLQGFQGFQGQVPW